MTALEVVGPIRPWPHLVYTASSIKPN